MDNWLTFINTLVIMAGSIGGIMLWRSEKRLKHSKADKTDAEAATLIKDASVDLLKPLTDMIAGLKGRIEALESQVKALKASIEKSTREEKRLNKIIENKNVELSALRATLESSRNEREALRTRVSHLEDVCRRAGINGKEV